MTDEKQKTIEQVREMIEYLRTSGNEFGVEKFLRWARAAEDLCEIIHDRDQERIRIVGWLGKFCTHADNQFFSMGDKGNTEFFRQKMNQQFGWEVPRRLWIEREEPGGEPHPALRRHLPLKGKARSSRRSSSRMAGISRSMIQ